MPLNNNGTIIILSILFLSVFGIFWTYFGYPFSLILIRLFHRYEIIYDKNYVPVVSLIITAFNEEKRIKEKIENTLKLIYPKDKLHVLIVSDGSSDGTHEIVSKYQKDGIRLLITKTRRGKEYAQSDAIKEASGEILVFSDVATLLEEGGIKEIVSAFVNESVGCVSSEDIIINEDGASSGEGAYVKYEMWLRKLESDVNSVVGLSGSFFAARKQVLQDFSGEMQSDFLTLLNCRSMGLRGISNPKAFGFYKNISDDSKEFERKIRTVVRGITVFFSNLKLLNPFKYGLFSYQYFSHKLLRWLVPWFMLFIFWTNGAIIFDHSFFLLLFVTQLVFYSFALIGLSKTFSRIIFFKIPLYFVRVNLGIFLAWIKYLKGERIVMWSPSARN